MYEKLSDKFLFQYFMLHSKRKDNIYSKNPFYITNEEYRQFVDTSIVLNGLVLRIINNINSTFSDFIEYIPDFKYKEQILNLKRPFQNVFWVRYDGFLKKDGGIFYSEFNYDKPCAEREILITGDMKVYNNINAEFRDNLKHALKCVIERQPKKEMYRVALLADPCHYEEELLTFLLKSELEHDNVKFIRVGPKNLCVKDDEVMAFNKKIDVILRLFPTEFSCEINDFNKILHAFDMGRVDIINDPRVIIGQCKNLYTYLWKLVENKDSRLLKEEISTILKTLPYTKSFDKLHKEYIFRHKDEIVIKPVYGRYSEDVFIGNMYSQDEWIEVYEYVKNCNKPFIIQDFCQIRQSDTFYSPDGNFLFPVKAFANIGCFLIEGKFSGAAIRWSDGYLTEDENTFITPIGVKSDVIKIKAIDVKNRKNLWNKVTERAMFEADFTGRYAMNNEYISLDYVELRRQKYEELVYATEKLSQILDKTQNIVLDNIEYFADILGIRELKGIAKDRFTNEFVFLARMDWAIDFSGNLKLLEINSETPAGLVESMFLDKIIIEELNISKESSNETLKEKIIRQFKKIIEDYKSTHIIKTIGILSSTYYEDWYTANAVYKIVKDLPYEFVIGSIYDCKVSENGKLSLFGKELDAVYRYYPLDFFKKENIGHLMGALKNTLSINPVHTIVSQSKAFFAVMYEFLKQGLYNDEEKKAILKYIPRTSVEVGELNTFDYIIKPVLSREGIGVKFACELKELPEENYIFQERVEILNLEQNVYSNMGKKRDSVYPIIGTYITGKEFAGIYTRLGKLVTGNTCMYAPTFIK